MAAVAAPVAKRTACDNGCIPLGRYESCGEDPNAFAWFKAIGYTESLSRKCADNQMVVTFSKGGLEKEYVMGVAFPAPNISWDTRFVLGQEVETRGADGAPLKSSFVFFPDTNELEAKHRKDGCCSYALRYTFRGNQMTITRTAGGVTSVRKFNKA
ncbi:uncharacterized protein LOC129591027 [Paramacrobiotus metropolitanus]|uniref:uncharacterized protein LOC129591027 n=1 Tax=Paramacrobiotus metropolitanus TaxID=2943436 RepID=UPI002445755A|nr:uncharacterized protein LOC129591027 [Paramacrobiotus metropolitanus]